MKSPILYSHLPLVSPFVEGEREGRGRGGEAREVEVGERGKRKGERKEEAGR